MVWAPGVMRRAYQRARASLLPQAWLLIGLIAVADWKVDDRVPLGWLYLLPVSMVASQMGRAGIVGVAVLCTTLAEFFDGFKWQWRSGLSREVLYFSAFAGIGLFVHQTLIGRRAAIAHMNAAAEHMLALETEVQARREVEEQLEVLIESTPVAVFLADATGTVLLANEAAGHLFALAPGELPGRSISEFIPPLLDVPALREGGETAFRTVMQCRGRRATGEIFQADVWFSTYRTSTGPRLAALVVDTSDELRNREESSLDQLLAGSRILVGAVSHEVRNVCAAIKVVYENLARAEARADASDRRDETKAAWIPPALSAISTPSLTTVPNKDFEALGTLVVALERIASMELSQAANQFSYIDLESLLEEVLIVIAPALREQEIALKWQVDRALPLVWADRQSLMQVFLNLVKNSERAMEASMERTLTISTTWSGSEPSMVRVRVADTGIGVQHPELLFKPFQQQASATGLGLYLSRAMMRSFSGELRYEPAQESKQAPGACFVVELNAAVPRAGSAA